LGAEVLKETFKKNERPPNTVYTIAMKKVNHGYRSAGKKKTSIDTKNLSFQKINMAVTILGGRGLGV